MNVTKAHRSNGVFCNAEWIKFRKCESFKSCTECLAEWPYYKEQRPICKWCIDCHGKCIPVEKNCDEQNKCKHWQKLVDDVNQCGERLCPASDCDKCKNGQGNCVWTRQVLKTCKCTKLSNIFFDSKYMIFKLSLQNFS